MSVPLKVQLSAKDISWLAGLLEGEGCFKANRSSPQIALVMTDEDVVKRAATLLGTEVTRWSMRGGRTKFPYCTTLCGSPAVAWMMTLYPLMGVRRKARIREVIAMWRALKPRYTENTLCGHTDRPYCARGLCARCYDKQKMRRLRHQWAANRRRAAAAKVAVA